VSARRLIGGASAVCTAHNLLRRPRMKRLVVGLGAVVAVAVVAATGCGTSASSHDGGTAGAAGGGSGGTTGAGGAAGASGSGGTTGAGGRAGSGGSGGGGGSAASACPSSVPTLNASCTVPRTCYYEDCTDTGRTLARCVDGAWSLDTGPCATGVSCQAQTCPVGQVCVERIGGALIAECVQNTCGTGPIGCDCLQSCAGTCTVGGSVPSGITIMCNTCPTNTCP
jgi:hypothetical protein